MIEISAPPVRIAEQHDDRVIVRGEGESVAVITSPWTLGETPSGQLVAVRGSHRYAVDGAPGPLSEAEHTALAAHQLAGLAVVGLWRGIGLSGLDVRIGGRAFEFAAAATDEGRYAFPVRDLAMALLGYQVAGISHLAEQHPDGPAFDAVSYANANFVVPMLLSVDSPEPVAFLFGGYAPLGWAGQVIQIEHVRRRAVQHLERHVDLRKGLAEHLIEHGQADAEVLAAVQDTLRQRQSGFWLSEAEQRMVGTTLWDTPLEWHDTFTLPRDAGA